MELFEEVGKLYEQYKDSGKDMSNGEFVMKCKEIERKYNSRLANRLVLDILVEILEREQEER